MKIYLIRHSLTKGNLEKRYIGVTEEDLCQEGIILAQKVKNFYSVDIDFLYTSPRKRCIETAKILFPEKEIQIENRFAEFNFGIFENKNYLELENNTVYKKWIDSGGTMLIPKGESKEAFVNRCVEAFKEIIEKQIRICNTIVFVIHGGTIMAIMERFAYPQKGYYDWQVKNCSGYLCETNCEEWSKRKIKVLSKLEREKR